MKNYKNDKIGIEFYNLLNTKDIFQKNWKAIYPSFIFLQRINSYNERNEGMLSTYSYLLIKDIFQSVGEYRSYLECLVELNLLVIDETYKLPTKNEKGESNQDGECKSYGTTELANDLLYTSNIEYLKKLHEDEKLIKKTKHNINKRKVMSLDYNDFVLNYIHDGLIHMKYDYNKVMEHINASDKTILEKNQLIRILTNFKEKKFNSLHRNESDNRIWNEFVAICSDYRKYFKYKNMERKAIVDIRACWPTFWSSYVLSINSESPQKNGGTKLTTTTHYTGAGVKVTALLDEEHKKWVDLFCNQLIDPRVIIMKECGYVSKDETKSALIETLNGSPKWTKFLKWLEVQFPNLFAKWNETDRKQTGLIISREYETVLMENEILYKMADEMDLKLTYEYDGFSVYVDNDKGLVNKTECLVKYIQSECERKFGISLVIKIELILPQMNELLQASKEYEFNKKKAIMEHEYKIIHEKYVKQIRKTHGFQIGTENDLKRCRKLKDEDVRLKNNLNVLRYEFNEA